MDWACPGDPPGGGGEAWFYSPRRPGTPRADPSSQSLLEPVAADPFSSFPTILLHEHAPAGPGLT